MGFLKLPSTPDENTGKLEQDSLHRCGLDTTGSCDATVAALEFAEILDASALQSLLEDFYALAEIPVSIIDLKGRVLVGVGWQDICTDYHRANPQSCQYCLESDLQLSADVTHGQYKLYRCKNNMWDVVTPITVGGKHVGNLFSGQFFFDDEEPNRELFRRQAQEFGFNEAEYLAALDRVPRLSREKLARGMAFFVKLAELVSRLGFSNVHLAQLLSQRDALATRFASIIDSAMDAIIIIDENLNMIVFNDAAEKTFGYATRSVLGKPLDCLVPERFRHAHAERIREFGATGATSRAMFPAALWGLRANGEEFPIEASISQVEAAGQKLYTVILRDITQRKQTEQALIRSEKLATVGRLAATVAHEINNPLSAVMNVLYLLKNDATLTPTARQYAELAELEVSRASQIARQTLGFSRQAALPSSFRPAEMLDTVLALLDRKLKEKGVSVNKQCPSEAVEVIGVAGEIRQVFWNLLSNALDAVPEQGRIVVRIAPAGDWRNGHVRGVRITVADNGNGIARPTLAHVFEPFFTTKSTGTGLGLWVTKEIVAKHGGSIRVRSRNRGVAQSGTVFSVFLPAEAARAVERQIVHDPANQKEPAQKRTV